MARAKRVEPESLGPSERLLEWEYASRDVAISVYTLAAFFRFSNPYDKFAHDNAHMHVQDLDESLATAVVALEALSPDGGGREERAQLSTLLEVGASLEKLVLRLFATPPGSFRCIRTIGTPEPGLDARTAVDLRPITLPGQSDACDRGDPLLLSTGFIEAPSICFEMVRAVARFTAFADRVIFGSGLSAIVDGSPDQMSQSESYALRALEQCCSGHTNRVLGPTFKKAYRLLSGAAGDPDPTKILRRLAADQSRPWYRILQTPQKIRGKGYRLLLTHAS